MKRTSGPRKTANLSDSIHQRLNMYAIAAGASVIALAQPSEAKIVYTRASVHIALNQHYDLDLNNDLDKDFTITNGGMRAFNCGFRRVFVSEQPSQGNGAEGSRDARALAAGERIGHSQGFYGGKGLMASYHKENNGFSCAPVRGGSWFNASDLYLGLRFKIHRKTHYGWARMTVKFVNISKGFTVTLTGYAYETIVGKSIKAGQTKEADDPTNEDFGASLTSPIPDSPRPASLGVLALGAEGVPLWRRKESALQVDALVSLAKRLP